MRIPTRMNLERDERRPRTKARVKSYSERAKLVELGEDKSSQRVFMAPWGQGKELRCAQINPSLCQWRSGKISLAFSVAPMSVTLGDLD